MKRKNLVLILICILIVSIPLFIKSNSLFGGTDDMVQSKVAEISTDYKPWFSSLWKPPSPEVESFLFTLQAAIGGGFVGYYIGRKKNVKDNNSAGKDK
jgi:cobalt/nickel transport protein